MARAGQALKQRWWAAQPARTGTPVITARRAYLEVLVVFGVFFASSVVLAVESVAGHYYDRVGLVRWSDAVPGSIDQVATTVLCVLVPVLLVQRRGLTRSDLGLDRPRHLDRGAKTRMAAWAVLAFLVGGAVTGALATGQAVPDHLPAPALVEELFHGLQAGPLEEIVVLGFVVTTLEQARRPRSEIVAVAIILRASYHIYYGPGVLGILIWAPVFVWLYLRFRTVVPLIIVHSTWDTFALLAHQWKPVIALDVLWWLTLFVAAFVSWLVDRAKRSTGGPALAGWYPDPGGSGGVRWYDGTWGAQAHPGTWDAPPVAREAD